MENHQLWNDRVSNFLLAGFFFSWKIDQLLRPTSDLHSKLSVSNVSVRASGARAKRSKEQGFGGETR